MKFLNVSLSRISYNVIPFDPNILHSTLFWNTLGLYSLNISDQVLHPFKTTDKIILSYILLWINVFQIHEQLQTDNKCDTGRNIKLK
jgi:hypothetical protein